MNGNHFEATDEKARALWWQFASAAIAVVLIFFLLSSFGGRRSLASDRVDTAISDLMAADWAVKTALFMHRVPGPDSRRQAREQLWQALRQYRDAADAGSPSGARKALVLGYELEGTKGLDVLPKLTAPKTLAGRSKKDIADLRSEAAMWRDIYTGKLTPKKTEGYAARIRNLRLLGPVRGYALEQLFTRGEFWRSAETAMDDAISTATITYVPGMLLLLMLCGGGVIGLALIVLYLVMLADPRRDPAQQLIESEPKPVEAKGFRQPWVLFQAFTVYVGLLLGLSAAASSVFGPRLMGLDSEQRLLEVVLLQFVLSAVTGLISLAVLLSLLRTNRGRLADIGLSRKDLGRNVLWGIGGFCALLPIYFIAAKVSGVVFRGFHTPEHPVVPMLVYGGTRVFVLLFVTGAVFAPFFEEIFFRGSLYRGLRARLGFVISAAIASSAFALVHPQLPAGFLSLFGIGAVACVLVESRKSLVPSMVMHSLNNGMIFLLLYLLYIA